MKEVLKKIYNNVKPLHLPFREPENRFTFHFVEGAFLEILGPEERQYRAVFTDQKTNEVVHESIISNNMWTKSNRQYFTEWLIQVFDLATNELVFEHRYDATGKRVYIHMDSTAVGDTLAWFPFIDEFRKKHNCEVITSTFHNNWFIKTYPEIKFVKPGTQVNDIYAMYNVGWFYDEDHKVNLNKNVTEFKNIPLGKTSSDILGLEYIETKPKV